MNEEQADALIGQLAANQVLLSALLPALIGALPELRALVAAQAGVAAPAAASQLTPAQIPYFREQMDSWWKALQRA